MQKKLAIFAAMKKQNNPLILLLDTATEVCSVALSRGAEILAVEESHDGNSHAKRIISFIERVLKVASVNKNEIDAVALSIGPGSYTGLRIGASTAKGLCYSLDLPLVTISTLESIMTGIDLNNSLLFIYLRNSSPLISGIFISDIIKSGIFPDCNHAIPFMGFSNQTISNSEER